ncbi:hemin-degrading factor [Pseudomonas fontis]|uniref:Hemin-degrading factor n=1 Tax=Pseudomonas fontis TaxID=2942633 RepID=A0ABT5NY03_9PSED|nr:ChuX/HutX family heme-like substrate-binding protein [Pseudomonas fontis]MDD0972529.1 hemin-degrading factor [Pseudomonas fontis]MDD0993053.1 hemin-degrading factor [Pseudomonas fontis]
MTAPISAQPTASNLYQRWQLLRQEQPGLRARDAAAKLGVSEAELTASRLGVDAVRLRPEWAALLPALGELGYIMALTRNEHCVHERKGVYHEVTIMGSGQMGMVLSPDIDLRLFLSGWASVFAVDEATARGPQRSIQVFDQQGLAVHKVYLTDTSEAAAWAPLVERFRAEAQTAELELKPQPEAKAPRPDADVDSATLRSEWSQLKDTHDFFGLLRRNDVARTQALRLAGHEWAEQLATVELTNVIEEAGKREVPIMVFVGNKHCIQIHSGPVSNLRWMDTWFNVLDPAFNLHLKTTGVTELWRVRKPSVDGIVTSYEGFDADGELVIQLFGVRKPGVPERNDWRALAETASRMTA